MTQTHALFLEWYCIQAVRGAGRYTDQNGNSGSRPHTPPPLEADCLEMFETASTLLATLGHPLFEPLAKTGTVADEEQFFYCTASGVDGRGLYTSEGFEVLKGSVGRLENSPSIGSRGKFRQKFLDSDVVEKQDGRIIFLKDHLFNAPSTAALSLIGQRINGWTAWKNEAGQTLDELKRQSYGSQDD